MAAPACIANTYPLKPDDSGVHVTFREKERTEIQEEQVVKHRAKTKIDFLIELLDSINIHEYDYYEFARIWYKYGKLDTNASLRQQNQFILAKHLYPMVKELEKIFNTPEIDETALENMEIEVMQIFRSRDNNSRKLELQDHTYFCDGDEDCNCKVRITWFVLKIHKMDVV